MVRRVVQGQAVVRRGRLTSSGSLALLFALVAIPALGLTLCSLMRVLPPDQWVAALMDDQAIGMPGLIFTYSALPRVTAALLCGGMLGLSGALFQQALRNPLAVPETLGVTAGAQLALAVVTLVAPAGLVLGRSLISFGGGGLAVALVLALSWRGRLAPLTVLLTGLVVTLTASSLVTLLTLFHAHDLSGLLLRAGGSLSLQDWGPVTSLTLGGGVLSALVFPIVRPLGLLSLDDASVRSLGVPLLGLRMLTLIFGVALTALVTGTFGTIDFIGFAAPALVRFVGTRRLPAQLAWSAAFGAVLLLATDGAVNLIAAGLEIAIPTGAATALLGTPLLIWLAGRSRPGATAPVSTTPGLPGLRRPGPLLATLALILLLSIVAAVTVGRGAAGWSVDIGLDLAPLLPWRLPRTTAAAAAGALLALSGNALQRVSANPMAAPEMLGLSAGAGFGLMAAIAFGAGSFAQAATAMVGAGGTALALLLWAARSHFEPGRLLVTGLALMTCLSALVSAFGATGDPRALQLMAWMTGSTYRVTDGMALLAVSALVLLSAGNAFVFRWLDLAPLGSAAGRALGVPPQGSRFALYLLAAALAGAGTLIVGPLSFVGLIAPHIAAACGLRRALAQSAGAALTGALVMVAADWGGRTLDFPWQVPSGIVAALMGAPVLLILLTKARA